MPSRTVFTLGTLATVSSPTFKGPDFPVQPIRIVWTFQGFLFGPVWRMRPRIDVPSCGYCTLRSSIPPLWHRPVRTRATHRHPAGIDTHCVIVYVLPDFCRPSWTPRA